MFLDNQKNERGTFKNKPENFYMKQKIYYIFLLMLPFFHLISFLFFLNIGFNILFFSKRTSIFFFISDFVFSSFPQLMFPPIIIQI